MPVQVDENCLYTESHEWLRIEGEEAYTGITDFAQDSLSDVVYVELPDVGDTFEQGEPYGVIESVKAASDCYLPLAGEILEVNEELEVSPELVNEDPYGEGWFVRFKIEDPDQINDLMDPDTYKEYAEKAQEEGTH
ncbi:MAG: glycine cleavage system protein GcvH [Chloroflexota bacterium]|nr:glycine cleavage system protein GcvH [Chloroflexota bacterium]